MRYYITKKIMSAILVCLMLCMLVLSGCSCSRADKNEDKTTDVKYTYNEYPLERNRINLHLDSVAVSGKETNKDILLMHGVTYSSNEFDTDYEDYSLVRCLAKEGYKVWRLDVAGFGRSGEVQDGFMPDTDYAAEDINAAVDTIINTTGHNKIDILGWSWGTTTVSKFASTHSDKIRRIVLYAPILTGIGKSEVNEAFHHNTWEHAADDFQKNADGTFDNSIAEQQVIDIYCSNCWRYDGEYSPNGGRRDICVDSSVDLIDLSKLSNPTLIIYGDSDPYLNCDKINASRGNLPKSSDIHVIHGGSHMIMIEQPYYHEFQETLIHFLKE